MEEIQVIEKVGGRSRGWQIWTPFAAVAWSLIYAALGLYWTTSVAGLPYASGIASDSIGPLAGHFAPVLTRIIVLAAGLPAAVIGVAMLHGLRGRVLQPLFIIAGGLLAGTLLLLMTGLDLLVKIGYIPGVVLGLVTPDKSRGYLEAWTQWATIHQLLCLVGGFLWLGATVSYYRRSSGVCPGCGRRDGAEGWTSPEISARWGRIAVVVAMVAPVFYALTRFAWALGIPLGLSEDALRQGQETGIWIGGLSLAIFCLVGAALMLGLVQRWGEIFPRWMIGLAGRRVPIALAVFPAALASVLLVVGGIGIWSGLGQMVANAKAAGAEGAQLIWEIVFQVGPTLLFPVWGCALALGALGYYYRRRGMCKLCGFSGSKLPRISQPA